MKTLLLSITLTFFAATSYGQGYIPIPDTLAVWRQSFGGGGGPGQVIYLKEQIFTAEKVTIASFTYTALRKTGHRKPNYSSPQLFGFTDTLFGYFRNDISAQQVLFRYNLNDTSDRILYDFSLNIGDTIPSTWIGNNWLNVIDSIDTVWMFGTPRKRLLFYDYSGIPFATGAIIEGVGSIHGFAADLTVPLEPTWSDLECFSFKDSAYSEFAAPPDFKHPVYSGSSCWLYSEIKEFENHSSITTFPNPFSNQLNISFEDNEQTTISLYNFLGQLVLQQTFTNNTTVNTAQLAEGIYIYELRNEAGTVKTGKVVKQ